jgi:hypothetical protein
LSNKVSGDPSAQSRICRAMRMQTFTPKVKPLAACEAQEELVNFVGDDARPAIKRVQQMRRAAILKARGDAR